MYIIMSFIILTPPLRSSPLNVLSPPVCRYMKVTTNTHIWVLVIFICSLMVYTHLSHVTPQVALAWSFKDWEFPTWVACRLSRYAFHLVLRRNSKYPCADSVQPPHVLHHTMCARIQSNALWRFGVQSLNCGRMVHSLGIQTGSIRNIRAMRFLVHSHIFRPSPHYMILCITAM
jgi:hypothetical protein